MLIRCSDNCKFQEDGFCGLKNIYSTTVTSNISEINDSGCIYYKPKNQRKTPLDKNNRNEKNDNQKNVTQSNQEHQKYF